MHKNLLIIVTSSMVSVIQVHQHLKSSNQNLDINALADLIINMLRQDSRLTTNLGRTTQDGEKWCDFCVKWTNHEWQECQNRARYLRERAFQAFYVQSSGVQSISEERPRQFLGSQPLRENVTSVSHMENKDELALVPAQSYNAKGEPSSPHASLNFKVPQELWSGHKVTYDRLRTFGCEAYVHVPKELRAKLAPKSRKCILLATYQMVSLAIDYGIQRVDLFFVAVMWSSMRQRCINSLLKRLNTRKSPSPMYHLLCKQLESRLLFRKLLQLQLNHDEASTNSPRRSQRISHPPERFVPSVDFVLLTDSGEPSCYKEAMLADDHAKWELAMKSELSSIEKNGTWDLVPLPKDKKALPCKWVYKQKFASGIGTYKARLVAKGFKQEYGIDFEEIFLPVVKMTTLRMLLGLVATENLELVQMDVKTAFLHGDLDEEIYMQ